MGTQCMYRSAWQALSIEVYSGGHPFPDICEQLLLLPVPVVVAILSWPLARVFCEAPEKVLPVDSVEAVMLKMAVPLSFRLLGPYITLSPLPGKRVNAGVPRLCS